MKFYQEKVSEGLIQCELYRQCLNNGIFAYPEYKCRINGKRCRFDLAILNGVNSEIETYYWDFNFSNIKIISDDVFDMISEFIIAQRNVLTEL